MVSESLDVLYNVGDKVSTSIDPLFLFREFGCTGDKITGGCRNQQLNFPELKIRLRGFSYSLFAISQKLQAL